METTAEENIVIDDTKTETVTETTETLQETLQEENFLVMKDDILRRWEEVKEQQLPKIKKDA